MNRAFISLYVLLVLSIATIGWGLDKLWQSYGPEVAASAAKSDLVALLEEQLRGQQADEIQARVASLNQRLDADLEVFPLESLADSDAAQRIAAGELVQIVKRNGGETFYQRLPRSDWVLALSTPPRQNTTQAWLHQLLLIFFYLGIALVIFFWLRPLSRDLRDLERQTRLVGQDREAVRSNMRPGSPTYELSLAFNRMAERIRELLASHKEMTYAVSHELRTPLARMKFALELAESTDDAGKMRKQIESARQDVSEMDLLVNELLTYAAFEQENRELDCRAGDMRGLVEILVKRLVPDSDIQVEIRGQRQEMVCEWYLMETALTNLLMNARRFARSRIAITMESRQGDFILRVEDDGEGVPEEERERIFQSFVRLSCDANSRAHGFGLGLAIVRRILKWHRGSVQVMQSALGGACFELRWPLPA